MKKCYSHIIFCLALIISLLCPTVQAADGTSFDPTKVEVKAKGVSSIPVGTIISWPVAQNPADFQNTDGSYNWLECNGQSFDATVYPELFALVGPTVPDLRGIFLRGQGGNSAALGVLQGDAIRNISGSFSTAYLYGYDNGSGAFYNAGGALRANTGYPQGGQAYGFDASRVVPTAPENRPVNQAVRYLMRARP